MEMWIKIPLLTALVNASICIVCEIIKIITGDCLFWKFDEFGAMYTFYSGLAALVAIFGAVGATVYLLVNDCKGREIDRKGYLVSVIAIVLNVIYIPYCCNYFFALQ